MRSGGVRKTGKEGLQETRRSRGKAGENRRDGGLVEQNKESINELLLCCS